MAQLAIRGHKKRGREVIALLEMLGGINKKYRINFTEENLLYTIREGDDVIIATYPNTSINKIFTLEEFLEKFPYKVGDKVRLDKWPCTIAKMYWNGDSIIYYVKGADFSKGVYATDLQPYKEETMEDKPNLLQQLKEYFENTPREVIEKEWHEYDKYNEIGPDVEGYLEYVNNIRNPKYPKTYEECCEVLGIEEDLWFVYEDIDDNHINPACISNYRMRRLDLYHNLEKLIICRDAYWKIAGDWKPDWKNFDEMKHCIGTDRNVVGKCNRATGNKIFAFPTEEMRDAFYENFKDLIESCKELL